MSKTVKKKTQRVEKEQRVTRTMTIGDVVQKYPALTEVLLDNGIHCVGCGAAYYETLEQGFMGHGLSTEDVDRIVKEMNEYLDEQGIPEPTTGTNNQQLQITQKASDKLKQLLEEKKKESWGLRVCIMPGGCSGMSYGLDFEKEPESDDIVVETHGVKLFVDAESDSMLRGAVIDYVDALQGAGFKISNPNAKKTCGCGQSFG